MRQSFMKCKLLIKLPPDGSRGRQFSYLLKIIKVGIELVLHYSMSKKNCHFYRVFMSYKFDKTSLIYSGKIFVSYMTTSKLKIMLVFYS